MVNYGSLSARSKSSDLPKKTSGTNEIKNAKIQLKEIFGEALGTNYNLINLKNSQSVSNCPNEKQKIILQPIISQFGKNPTCLINKKQIRKTAILMKNYQKSDYMKNLTALGS